MKKITFAFCVFLTINSSAMVEKGAGMSSEQARINATNNAQVAKQYITFTHSIQNQIRHALNVQLKKTPSNEIKKKLTSLKEHIDEIIQSMGVLKFVITFAGLPNYARQYKNILNHAHKLQQLLSAVRITKIDLDALVSRFMHVYDHAAFAGDLDMYSAHNYLSGQQPGTYLIRISQKHTPGGFTFSLRKKDSSENRAGFYFTGNKHEIIYYAPNNVTKFTNLTDIITRFNFGQKLEKPIEIYNISLGSFWKTKNKY